MAGVEAHVVPKNDLEAKKRRLKQFLVELCPLVAAMYAGILWELGQATGNDCAKDKAKELLGKFDGDDVAKSLTYRHHYNLACSWALIGDQDNALAHLKRALERGGTLVAWACKDPSLKNVHDQAEFKKAWNPAALKVRYDLTWKNVKPKPGELEGGEGYTVIVVVPNQGDGAAHTSHRYDDVTVYVEKPDPPKSRTAISVELPAGKGDSPAVKFAAHLSDVMATYYLLAPPTQ
jgi:hypothetical protein